MVDIKKLLNRLKDNPYYIFRALNRRGFLKWLPDKAHIRLMYRARIGKKLDLDDPKTYNEKLQWLKLYDRKPEYTKMVDKYAVREYVADKIGEEYLVPLLGKWDDPEDIDLDALPEQFVLKCNHDSGSVIICRSKSDFDFGKAKSKLKRCLQHGTYIYGREWPYKNVKPCIIAEQYLEDADQQDGLMDYKFFCFDGKPRFLYVSKGLEDHSTASISFLNLDWSFAPFQRSEYKGFEILPKKPVQYEKMLEIATALSSGTSFLRVDLYEIKGKAYFSELTFTPCCGMMCFVPMEWDEKIGELLVLPNNTRKGN